MAIPKAKKPKKKEINKPTKTPLEIVKMANYVNIAAIVRTLWTVYDWREKRIAKYLEAHMALLDEAGRFGVGQMIKDTKDLTGIDVKKLVDEVLDKEK